MATGSSDAALLTVRSDVTTLPRVAQYWDAGGEFWLAVYLYESSVDDWYVGVIVFPKRYRGTKSTLMTSLFLEHETPFASLTTEHQGLIWEALLLLG